MTTAQTTRAVALSPVSLPLGLAKTAAMPFMRQPAAHLGMPPDLYRVIDTLGIAAAAGLLLGLASAPRGVAAAVVTLAALAHAGVAAAAG
ncbi:DoxX family protein [Streptomyces olivaceoviridis]|uniref:DoxX family protein n=1 Tax=Streptomyces olivaceoviridis TaxID=1921 RepID=UPI0036774C6C